ncbi:uncharacterized protein LOC125045927 [Penaeus chinensis]|uniref:uncharacterized protein LOC125045927 n=1 Tax=Penaeus chinensis TaxID=139456 RepID=UPI001FB6BAFE|nr:uncharacterized protein LOC125045927 [Penaeus chinensis]
MTVCQSGSPVEAFLTLYSYLTLAWKNFMGNLIKRGIGKGMLEYQKTTKNENIAQRTRNEEHFPTQDDEHIFCKKPVSLQGKNTSIASTEVQFVLLRKIIKELRSKPPGTRRTYMNKGEDCTVKKEYGGVKIKTFRDSLRVTIANTKENDKGVIEIKGKRKTLAIPKNEWTETECRVSSNDEVKCEEMSNTAEKKNSGGLLKEFTLKNAEVLANCPQGLPNKELTSDTSIDFPRWKSTREHFAIIPEEIEVNSTNANKDDLMKMKSEGGKAWVVQSRDDWTHLQDQEQSTGSQTECIFDHGGNNEVILFVFLLFVMFTTMW